MGDRGRHPRGVRAGAPRASCALRETTHLHPVATSAHFLAPTRPGIAQVRVEVLRTGRTACTVRAALVQDGAETVVAHVTSATLEGVAPDYEQARPATLAPEVCMDRPLTLPDGSPVRFLGPIEVRLDPHHVGGPYRDLSGIPEVRGWVREREGSPPDALFLLFCVDALPPSVLEIGGQGWSPTVQLSSYVRTRSRLTDGSR